jgi:S-adenosylmethionine:tRNA ribosyltransferase-isomerase
MRVSLFSYHLPSSSIAQQPVRPRDKSKLLVYDRRSQKHLDTQFNQLGHFLRPGDVLVFNNSKVFPARLLGKKSTGGKIELFLLRSEKGNYWQALLKGKGQKEGLKIIFSHGLRARAISKSNGIWHVAFNQSGKALWRTIQLIGETPTPPYIKKSASRTAYQTVYANDKKVGSVAAPTAGFHFTPRLLRELRTKGVQMEFVTLHVGYGTFAPIKTKQIEQHNMHEEYAEVGLSTLHRLQKAKKEGRRIIAVGTTSVRVLETVAVVRRSKAFAGWINAFFYPGYKFKIVDAMITNFHLPESTLLVLVSAFAGRTAILRLYQHAIQEKYRFYSFGDAMFLQ